MATAKICLDTRTKTPNNRYFIKIRVTHDRASRYYDTQQINDLDKDAIADDVFKQINLNRKFSQDELDRILAGKRPSEEIHNYRTVYKEFESKANKAIKKLPVFTWEGFERKYLKNTGAGDSLKGFFDEKIKQLREDEDFGNAAWYQDAINAIERHKPGLKLADVTPRFLKGFHKWMETPRLNRYGKMRANKPSTVSMRMRALRSIINDALFEGLISDELYPFARTEKERKTKYSIPGAGEAKRALTGDAVEKLFNYQSDDPEMQEAVDYWKICFLSNGANPKDILLLRHKNMEGNMIRFRRAKTRNMKKDPPVIEVPVTSILKELMKKYRMPSIDPEGFLFPILNNNMDAETTHKTIKAFTVRLNKVMKRVAAELKISNLASLGGSRHSLAMALKQNKAQTSVISEVLGHSSLKTTEIYLGRHDVKDYRSAIEAAIPQTKKAVNE